MVLTSWGWKGDGCGIGVWNDVTAIGACRGMVPAPGRAKGNIPGRKGIPPFCWHMAMTWPKPWMASEGTGVTKGLITLAVETELRPRGSTGAEMTGMVAATGMLAPSLVACTCAEAKGTGPRAPTWGHAADVVRGDWFRPQAALSPCEGDHFLCQVVPWMDSSASPVVLY
ncbi:unnamed protein product [Cuscuta campestris]|uniref:Uncharacterized protein n=1 Tax=Cuscuta campestris TaxID=132261 RepID=A0A484MZV2_9ASTE|nr:unnamed protein product [Cuscuta campestris]